MLSATKLRRKQTRTQVRVAKNRQATTAADAAWRQLLANPRKWRQASHDVKAR